MEELKLPHIRSPWIWIISNPAFFARTAAGVMTFEACNKKDKGSVEPAAQNKNPQDATVSYLDDSGYNVNISRSLDNE